MKEKLNIRFYWARYYKSIKEKAAYFLYLIVKNYAFTDGNKRIAATLFIIFWILSKMHELVRTFLLAFFKYLTFIIKFQTLITN